MYLLGCLGCVDHFEEKIHMRKGLPKTKATYTVFGCLIGLNDAETLIIKVRLVDGTLCLH